MGFLRMYPIALFPDFRRFYGSLIGGIPYEPEVRCFAAQPKEGEPSPENWFSYYSTCIQYITSLHNQFVAVLSIQGALAIGSLAVFQFLLDRDHAIAHVQLRFIELLGISIAATELVLTLIAIKLIRQHCVMCWMLARIEQEKLGLPKWACAKALLGTQGNRLFTSPLTFIFTALYGALLGIGLGVAAFAAF